ncbi:hypothetical protein CRUP_017109 [Coryphaenoides rupestris]|nr:hypothetical protein CRUP_017109 [Coryphaenoides rupestris]
MGCFTFVKVMMILFNVLIFVRVMSRGGGGGGGGGGESDNGKGKDEMKKQTKPLGGIILLVLGIWASVDGDSLLQILGTFSSQAMQFVNVGFFCIAVGALLLLLSLLGFFAAHRESRRRRSPGTMFFSIILIIFIGEVAAGVAEGILRAWATPALKDQYGSDPVVTKIWNTTMIEGCFGMMLEIIKMNANIVGGVAAGIGALEIAAMVVSMYLYCDLDSRDPMLKH